MTRIEAELKEAAKVMEHNNWPSVMVSLCHSIEGGFCTCSLTTEGILRGFDDMYRFYVPALVDAMQQRLLEIEAEAETEHNWSGKDEERARLRKLCRLLNRTLDMWEEQLTGAGA